MSSLFRKEAVEGFRDQFLTNKHIGKLSFSSITFSLIFIVGLISVMCWFFMGNIVETTEITGVVYPSTGLEKICANRPGTITEMNFAVGDVVSVGDVIAVMPDSETVKEIEEAVESGADEEKIEKLRRKYYDNSLVVSGLNGTIITLAKCGDYRDTGDPVARIAVSAMDGNSREILAFLPTSEKNNIKNGCKVQVSPDYAKREKYGFINGHVADIGENVITRADAEIMYNTYNIPLMLEEDKTYVTVSIDLAANSSMGSGLDWSSAVSGDIDVRQGTVCRCSIVVSEKPPYKWLLGGG